ncbi:MAG: hypothetical protein GY714_17100 [Desulfobacterales bacterium]|nr:hypothetical protein [Desulfobacterales bacterium]
MKILLLPFLSVIMSLLYYSPWIGEVSRAKLGPYILAFLWFIGAWIIAIVYIVLAFKNRKDAPELTKIYLIGVGIFLISYAIVWIGILNGYMVTV